MARLPDITGIDPVTTITTVTVRIPQAHKNALAALATRKRMETGALVHTSDLIREALAQYLERESAGD
jgi:predicted transcriptional regulator